MGIASLRPRHLTLVVALIVSTAATATASHRIHVVEPGQTLWSIAYRYGVTVEALVEQNAIRDVTQLAAGDRLQIPDSTRTPDATPSDRSPRRYPPAAAPPRDGETRFIWPLRGRITSKYGRRGRSPHTGIDIAATQGTIIVASDGGRVVRAGTRWGRYGVVVLIEHDSGFRTLYSHLSRNFVSPGDIVNQGQAIAAVGATGNASGPHLHFEVWHHDETLDPLSQLDRAVTYTAQNR